MINKMFWVALAVIITVAVNLTAQKKNTLIQGKVFEDATNQPLSATFVFLSESGKYIKIKSNGFDGSFQGVIENGYRYSIGVTGWLIVKPQNFLDTPEKDDYRELTWQFRLKKMQTGLQISAANAFNPGSAALAGSYLGAITDAFGFLEANPNTFVVIEVSAEDTFFAPKTEKRLITDKKGKSKTASVRVPPEEQMQKLLDDRVASLGKFIENFKKYNRRIQFEKVAKQGVKPKPAKQKKKSQAVESANTPPIDNKIGRASCRERV